MIEFLKEKGYKEENHIMTYAPQYVNWNYSYICNMNCKHCYSRTRQGQKPVSTAEKHKIVDNIIKNNVFWVNLGGGEPILEDDIYEIIDRMSSRNIHVSLSSNGTYLTEERVKKLAEAKLTTTSISLDSSIPEKHNAVRGYDDSFDNVMRAIKLCGKYGIRVMISTVITTQNYKEIEDIIKLCIEKNCQSISLKRIKMTGNAEENKDLELNEDQIIEVYKTVMRVKEKYPDFVINFTYGAEKIKGLDDGCACGKAAVAILPNGNVVPCVYNDILCLGNAITDDLGEMFHSPKLEYLRKNYKCLGSALAKEMENGNVYFE